MWTFEAFDILNCSCQGLLYSMIYIFVGHWTLETLHHKLICNQIFLICWRLFNHSNQFDIPSKCKIVYSLNTLSVRKHINYIQISQKFLLTIFFWIELVSQSNNTLSMWKGRQVLLIHVYRMFQFLYLMLLLQNVMTRINRFDILGIGDVMISLSSSNCIDWLSCKFKHLVQHKDINLFCWLLLSELFLKKNFNCYEQYLS